MVIMAFSLVYGAAIEARTFTPCLYTPDRSTTPIVKHNVPVCGGDTVAACCQTNLVGVGAACK